MAEFAFQYWERVDELRGKTSIPVIAEAIGVPLQTLKNMRSQNRYPKADIQLKLAEYLGTTVDYLMTGKDSSDGQPGFLCPEAQFVQDHPESRAIVRIMMKDLSLVPHLSAVFSAVAGDDMKEKKA